MLVAAIAVLALSAPGLSPNDCRDPHKLVSFASVGFAAIARHDSAGAKSNFDDLISVCGNARATWIPRLVRAQIALDEKDYDRVLTALAPVPRPGPPPIGSRSSWMALLALKAKGDEANFERERAALLAGVDRALSDNGGPYTGRRIETFSVNGATVTAYQTKVRQGGFVRLIEFVIKPAGPMDLPESIVLTEDLNAEAMAKQLGLKVPAPYFIDEYDCDGHSTVKMLAGEAGGPPSYNTTRTDAIDFLNGKLWVSRTSPPSQTGCHWPNYITPGLGD